MAIKKYRPYTPSRRFMMGYDFSNITTDKPHKPLTKFLGKTWGRNQYGRTTSRFMWGGHKKLYRLVDFRWYDIVGVAGRVSTIEYDPYRNCRICLINYTNWQKRYILAWSGVKVWDKIINGVAWEISEGCRLQLKDIPDGYLVHNLEFTPFTKGKIVRSAWSYATIQWRDEVNNIVIIKLQSGEVRKFNPNCRATIGTIGNEDFMNVEIGKAGRQRWMWKKPFILGKSMNPVDHPHGGWEWHQPIAMKKWPKARNGRKVVPGMKTRQRKKPSNTFIISRRTRN